MSDLKPCGCGDKPESSFKHGYHDEITWEIRCRECEIFVYAPTQEQSETLWNDAMSARELREAKPKFRPDYLCGLPACEANTRGIVAEYTARIAELEAQTDPRYLYDVETPCPACNGRGRRAYGSTATWSGGAGGQTITGGVCDKCWGSGDATRPGANLRLITNRIKELEAKVKAMRCCENCEYEERLAAVSGRPWPCNECEDNKCWQPRPASKEG